MPVITSQQPVGKPQPYTPEGGVDPVPCERERDPLAKLPLMPAMAAMYLFNGSGSQERAKISQARRATNRLIKVIRACWNGDFSQGPFLCGESWSSTRTHTKDLCSSEWDSATSLQRKICRKLFLANLEFQLPAGTPQGAEAFQSLVSGAATSGYASVSPGPDSGPEFLRKGSVCPPVA